MNRGSRTPVGPEWLSLAASGLALASCYGTLAAVTVLSALGVAIGLDEGLWAAAIALFTLLAVGAVALGRRRHGQFAPAILAAAGCGLIFWVVFGDYNLTVELAGFVALLTAAILDWRLGRARG